jgi:NhaA family Na+:H+ antiporter
MNTPRVLPSAQPTFLQSDRRLARLAKPIARFLRIEAAGGVLLVVATVVALVWANSPWRDSYVDVWHALVEVRVGSYTFSETVAHVVNDGLMALFFFVVGMEIKRELVVGELRDRRHVALPAMAALGGMVVPALIFLAFNAGGEGAGGWGIPMATDIAFALGVIALLGRRVPNAAKLLLLTLAIVDDIGAIVVIAVFYSDGIDPTLVGVAVAIVAVVAAAHRLDVTYTPLFAIAGAALWLVVYESGVHATIAGVAMGLVTPARPRQPDLAADEIADMVRHRGEPADVRRAAAAVGESVSMCDRMIDALHPWTSYLVVPLFALANAGIELSGETFTSGSAVFAGVALGLVVGKLVGVTSFSWLAVRLGLGRLPPGVGWSHVVGIAGLAGIGFTVSLFVTGLAFTDEARAGDAKAGILAASFVAAWLGAALLSAAARRARRSGS